MAPSKARAKKKYHVFLSFSGDDRYDFPHFLHERLVEAKLRVFRDEDDIEVGDEIGKTLLQAIDNSKIYIPVISQTYPDRKWCLIELERMMINVSGSKGEKRILPIFFNVKAGDVKHWTPQPKNLPVKPGAWKEALAKVGQIKGWKVQKGQSQKQIINSVVQTVLEKLGKKEESQTEHLIEPDDLTKSVEDSFNRIDKWDSIGRGRSLSRGSTGRSRLRRTSTGRRWRSLSIHRKEYMYMEKCSGSTGRREFTGSLRTIRYMEEYNGSPGRRGRSGSSSRSSSSSVRGRRSRGSSRRSSRGSSSSNVRGRSRGSSSNVRGRSRGSSSSVRGRRRGSSRRSSEGSSERKSSKFSFAALMYFFCNLCSNRSPVARSLENKKTSQ